jgi:thiamine-monophosphate kinase
MKAQKKRPLPDAARAELALIEQVRNRVGRAGGAVRLGIGDDCALLALRPGEEMAVTTDLSISGRHFRLDWHPPESVGHRALARGLSDLAAMGARPVAAFLSLGLPSELTKTPRRGRSWLTRFYDGLLSLAEQHSAPLAGGDLAESPLAFADIVLTGAVPRGKALLRSGARPGHLLYVTGSLGGAAAGLAGLSELATASDSAKPGTACPEPLRFPENLESQLAAHLYPRPRLAQGQWLLRHSLASAAIDLSDGLSTDLAHLCAESEVGAEIDAALLSLHRGATLEQALHGGEDYELLFTAPPAARLPKSIAGVAINRIGRIVRAGKGQPQIALLTGRNKQPLMPHGWEHFS